MLNKSSKSLVIALILIVVIGALVFFLSKDTTKSADQSPVIPIVAEQQPAAAPPVPIAEAPKAAEVAPALETEAPKIAEAAPAETAASVQEKQNLLAAPEALTIDLAAAMHDRVIGSDSAPVTITEYASMTCPHCAHFATEILPEVKKLLIDTGKAKLIFRDFPLDNFAIKAAMMARCIPADKYFSLVEVIFNNQDRWITNKDPLEGLAQLGALAGMDADLFKACTQNKTLETAILNIMQDAQTRYDIKSTPTFVFNNGAVVLGGAQDAAKFEQIVNKLTQGK
jgi:protein-disulfide isomerase